MDAAVFSLPRDWPRPSDEAAARRLAEQFAALGPAEAGFVARPEAAAMLAAIAGNSPYLPELALREPAVVLGFAAQGPGPLVADAIAAAAVPPDAPRARVAAALRGAKRVVALATALADIGRVWPLARVTAALSDLAETALRTAVAHLLRAAHEAGELTLPDPADPARGSGFTVLGMGKLGARELNYSSDVDLIVLYDPAARVYTGDPDGMGIGFTRLARGLVALMEARDAEGYVFRTDLRLRPDPAATPPAMTVTAAIGYYESMGQNWERAAMIKARPVAGDLATGAGFLEAIRPFVWRRGLDFAAVADIHAMKRRIDAHRGGAQRDGGNPAARIAGHNVKLGEGGIREIEFLVQTLQMVWGGRDPTLRDPTTLGALRLLMRAGHVRPRAAGELAAAYRFLRGVEHRLQMVNDRQVHSLPERAPELARFATFMGFASLEAFAARLLHHLARVRARYAELFEHVPDLPDAHAIGHQLDVSGVEAEPEPAASALRALGFHEVARVIAAIRAWQSGRLRALRSERARDLLRRMLPAVLAALAHQPQPDAAFARFEAFLAALPAGVQILSLFERNPGLLERLSAVFGAAPSLAEHLARYPASLEGLLAPEEDTIRPAALLRARLADARVLEDAIGIIRRAVREEDFSLSVATMEGRLDADRAGLRRTALADAALAVLAPRVLADFAARHGRVRGGAMAVVALGKAGGREMMAGSDLDLMLIYDHPPEVTESEGARRLPASQWFIRAVHAFIAALTAPGADGPLYQVDMRLRPSGNKGPVAVSLAAFRRYHAEDAWTWERMALTRARVVAGPPAIRARVRAAIDAAVAASGEPAHIRADAAAMRSRLARELPPDGPWDVNGRPGGLMEVEFVAQALQLVHARAHPRVCSPTTRTALARLAAAGLLPRGDARALIRADLLWRTIQGMLRITVGRNPPARLPGASAAPLLRATGAVDLSALEATIDEAAHAVRAAFVRHLGEIGS
jgi:glutamate-ammonia-ligase adenylyltransferase